MAISDVQIVSVPVSDQDRALAFYVGVLDFEVVDDVFMGPSMRWVRVRPRGGTVALALVTWFETMPAGSSKGLVLLCEDVDAEYARLVSRGVELAGEVQEQPWGRFFSLDDPDGNGIIVQTASPR